MYLCCITIQLKTQNDMGKIIAITQLSIDGVMQAPGGPEEDPSSDFKHGGWFMHYGDDMLHETISEIISGEFEMLLGRRTYDIFASYWPLHDANPKALLPFRRRWTMALTSSIPGISTAPGTTNYWWARRSGAAVTTLSSASSLGLFFTIINGWDWTSAR